MKNRLITVRRLALLAIAALAFLTLPSCIHHRGHLHAPWLLPALVYSGHHYNHGHSHSSSRSSRSYRKSPRRAPRRTSTRRPRRAVRR